MTTETVRGGAELTLAGRVVELAARIAGPGAEAEVVATHTADALTRFANSAIHQNVAEATTAVRLRLHVDGRTAVGSTTVTDAAGLAALVERTVAAARISPPDARWPGLTPPAPLAAAGLVDEGTAQATPDERAARIRDFVAAAGGLETAGFCRTSHTGAAFANSAGQSVEGRAADAGMDGIARVPGADGVARWATGRLAELDGAALGARAAAKARAAADPVELPPGRYEVVLEPEAVADLLTNLAAFGFNGKAWAQGESFAELGAAQFDPAITLVDEPLGIAGEPVPGLPFDVEGTPRAALVLVRNGTTAAVTHDRRSGADAGAASTGHGSPVSRSWGPVAHHLRLVAGPAGPFRAGDASGPAGPAGGGPGPVAPSAAPLVAGVARGLLITDLWYTRVLDQKSLVVTGLTRNGVWLIEDGRITRAVGNMRFTQSYPLALAPGAVRGIGAESVPLPDRWSGVRHRAPALHLASWQLTGNASG
ncbi:putative Zn-dependent protease [Krasilnikovia cinnamomea]|uniref:Putative Zn-dependent protease n=1 Tax=Krasilnikovia cinnamomea TaxID=349313 RepID=A0A4Q7ZH93_9ACTN|nr:metallopeptidase TldD-related protein [Krasilnikovia cinnamomea]RZU50182.1 putative Zn-dependent protease [Krasilnikovia cinnamomea]